LVQAEQGRLQTAQQITLKGVILRLQYLPLLVVDLEALRYQGVAVPAVLEGAVDMELQPEVLEPPGKEIMVVAALQIQTRIHAREVVALERLAVHMGQFGRAALAAQEQTHIQHGPLQPQLALVAITQAVAEVQLLVAMVTQTIQTLAEQVEQVAVVLVVGMVEQP
jgi:hypothetical protein